MEPTSVDKNWIDAHAHLTDPRIEDLDLWMRESAELGIRRFILGGIEPEEWQRQFDLQARYPGRIFPSVGLHPWWVSAAKEEALQEGLQALRSVIEGRRDAIVALGEMGLDFHPRFPESKRADQERLFRAQLRLAIHYDLPVVLHVVRAHPEALAILREEGPGVSLRGIVHSFSGSLEVAREYLAFGLVPSISAPVLTRGRGSAFEALKQALKALGPEDFVIETDLPDQPPSGEEGLNRPASLYLISRRIALIRREVPEHVLDRSQAVLERLFRL